MQPNNQPEVPQVPTEPIIQSQPPERPITVIPAAVSPKKKRFTKVFVLQIALALMIVGSVAGYFVVVLPNRPANIWSEALNNTAEGYDHLIAYAEQKKDFKSSKVKGDFRLEGPVTTDGTFNVATDDKNANVTFDFGAVGHRITAEARLITPENAPNPDIYFKASGVKGLGSLMDPNDAFGVSSIVDNLDNQWLVVDHSILDQLGSSAGISTTQFTSDDYVAVAKAVGKVNREYLLSDEDGKAVLKIVQNVGKEDRDGRSVYHYKVGYDKDHLKAYLTALKDELKNTKLVELAPDKNIDKLFAFEDMMKTVDKLKGDEQFDVYVDMGTRLLRVVRFEDQKTAGDFLEFAFPYNGGSEYPFALSLKASEGDPVNGTMKLALDTQTNVVKFNLDFSGKTDGQDTKLTANAEAQPSNDPITVTKPDGAKPWAEVLGPLFSELFVPSQSGEDTLPVELNGISI